MYSADIKNILNTNLKPTPPQFTKTHSSDNDSDLIPTPEGEFSKYLHDKTPSITTNQNVFSPSSKKKSPKKSPQKH